MSLQVLGCKTCGGKPIAAINRGSTRADPLLSLKINRDCIDTLNQLLVLLELED